MSIWEAFGMADTRAFRGRRGCCWTRQWSWRAALAAKRQIPATFSSPCSRQTGRSRAVLAGKNITELAVRRQLAEDRPGPVQHLDRRALAPDLRRAMDYASSGAECPPAPR